MKREKVVVGMSGGVDSSVAVSYTHLDVYKRQSDSIFHRRCERFEGSVQYNGRY